MLSPGTNPSETVSSEADCVKPPGCGVRFGEPQEVGANAFDRRADPFTDGAKWHETFVLALGLSHPLLAAGETAEGEWHPMYRPELPWEEAHEELRQIEAGLIDAIHASARGLVETGHLTCVAPEIRYFLKLRLRNVLDCIRVNFLWRSGRPASLIPFPSRSAPSLLEWFLTEWSDYHSLEGLFSE